HNLLLNSRLFAEAAGRLGELECGPGFVWVEDATLNAPCVTLDAILECGTQERFGIELGVFVRWPLDAEHGIERHLDMVEREAEAPRQPSLHQRLGRAKRCAASNAED